jgi:hypothetical protein
LLVCRERRVDCLLDQRKYIGSLAPVDHDAGCSDDLLERATVAKPQLLGQRVQLLLYLPSARASGGGSASTRSEFVDTWGNRIAFVFPGRAFRPLVDGGLSDPDGSVRTPYERVFGVCSNRRICMVSAGPDGLFGVAGESPEMTGTTAAAAAARAAAAGDNIYLYPLDPPS